MNTYLCQQLFQEAYSSLRHGPAPEISVDFYPYADLNHTIRLRNGRLLVRLSDITADAPPEVIRALAHILLGKLMRKRISPQFLISYRQYARSPQVIADLAHTRAERSRSPKGRSEGFCCDLKVLFDRLNADYFSGKLESVRLMWSTRRSFRRLGYYRQAVHTIVISKALDDPRVPAFVREFILYHEMLHTVIPTVIHHGRRYDHTPEFRAAERNFTEFEKAKRYLRLWPPSELRRRRRHKPTPFQLKLF